MRNIIKVNNILDAKNNPIRPLLALDNNGVLFGEGQAAGPTIEMVDLGLSVKWAKYNYGVNPEQLTSASDWYGKYLSWGELTEKEGWPDDKTSHPYNWANYTRHTNGRYLPDSNTKVFIKYIPTNKPEYWNGTGEPDNLTILESVDDVATQEYGSNYHMPTQAELNELIALPNQWVLNYNGVSGLNGRIFTGTNGNILFIPAAGLSSSSTISDVGSICFLWSSSLYLDNPSWAYRLRFDSVNICVDNRDRCFGFCVRPVC